MGKLILKSKHRLMCGDSTNITHVETLMNGENADFLFTSPPYLEMREYNNNSDLSLDSIIQFIPSFSKYVDFMAVNLGLSRKNGRINCYWNEYIKIAEETGFPLTSWNIWSRAGMGGSIANMSAMFPIEHEWIFIFGGEKSRVNRTKENKSAGLHTGISNRQKDGSTKKTSPKLVAEFGRMGTIYTGCYATGEKGHPAAFPVHLPEAYIEACSSSYGKVVEPFGGSGSTLIACEKTGRRCFCMEIDPIYCDLIIARWEKYSGLQAIKLNVAS
jgi:DNA modification methylase